MTGAKFLSALAAAAAVFFASDARAVPSRDIFARQAALAASDRDDRLLLDVQFGRPNAAEKLRKRLSENPPPNPAFAAEGWLALCIGSDRMAQFRQAVADCASSRAADPAHGGEDTLVVMRQLSGMPAPAARGAARVPFGPDGTISVVAGSYAGPAIPDTGATIAVMMQSVAARSGVRIRGKSRKVATATAPVSGQIGIIPRVAIGAAVVENLPVLVLPDTQLTYDNGKIKIAFLLSLQAMRAFGRVAWLGDEKVFALGEAAPRLSPGAVPVFWHPLGIGVPLDGPGGRLSAHFDTGSNTTFLFEPGLALVSGTERAALIRSTRRVGGIGGIVTENIRRLPTATLALAGQPFVLKNAVVAPVTGTGEAARIGEDMLKRYGTVVLDLDRMAFSARN